MSRDGTKERSGQRNGGANRSLIGSCNVQETAVFDTTVALFEKDVNGPHSAKIKCPNHGRVVLAIWI